MRRTVVWEMYAAAWNLSDALPREVLEARAAQQARFEDTLRGVLAVLQDPEIEGAMLSAIRDRISSPFQAAALCPAEAMTEGEVLSGLAMWKSWIRSDDGPRIRELKGTPFWRGNIDAYAHSMLAQMLGPLSSDIAPVRLRVVPLVPFPDASSYYSSSTGRPTFPRLIVR